jgi:hypothetical protein
MKARIGLVIMVLLFGCQRKDNLKSIAVFFDPSEGYNIPVNHIQIYLNGTKLTDKQIKKSTVPSNIFVECITVDSTLANEISIKINDKALHVNPAQYHNKCLAIFTSYNITNKIRSAFHLFEKQSIEKRNIIPDYNKYIDSVKRTNPKSKFDSIMYGVQLNRCWCDSAGRGYGY